VGDPGVGVAGTLSTQCLVLGSEKPRHVKPDTIAHVRGDPPRLRLALRAAAALHAAICCCIMHGDLLLHHA